MMPASEKMVHRATGYVYDRLAAGLPSIAGPV